MKFVFTLLFLLGGSVSMQAEAIDQKEAQQLAQQFFASKGKHLKAPQLSLAHRAPNRLAKGQNKPTAYYVFNAEKEQGYVVVSGDARSETILAYADSGHLDVATAPAPVKAFLQTYVEELAALNHSAQVRKTPAQGTPTERAKRAIPPMLSTRWNQGAPYYNQMPQNTTYRPAAPKHYTGCVATAMAQAMYYYKQPAATIDVIDGYKSETADWSGNYKKDIPSIAAQTSIAWNKMKPIYGTSYTEEQGNAVAQLMAMCATSVRAKLHSNETSAALSEADRALKEDFGYDASTRYVKRDAYDSRAWFELMYSELEAGRPVLYGGRSSDGGHAFILDGFDGNGYFHVNWGWGGLSDGYFRLSVMKPQNTGIGAQLSNGYSTSQEAIVGVRPSGGPALPVDESYYRLTGENFCVKPAEAGKEAMITCDFVNRTSWKGIFNYGWAVVKSDGALEGILSKSIEIGPNYMVKAAEFSLLNSDLKAKGNGEYKIVPISFRQDPKKLLACCDVNRQFVIARVAGNSVSYEIVRQDPKLSLLSWNLVGTKVALAPLELQMNLRNLGTIEYNGPLYLWRKDRPNELQAQTGAVVPAGETVKVALSVRIIHQGTLTYQVSTDLERTNILGETSVDITSHTLGAKLEVTRVEIEGAQETTPQQVHHVLGKKVKARVSIKNKSESTFGNAIQIGLLPETTPGSGNYSGTDIRTMAERMEVGATHVFEVEFDGLDTRKNYLLLVLSKDVVVETDRTPIVFTPCATMDKADGTSVSVPQTATYTVPEDVLTADFSAVSGMAFTPNSNPNTIYVLAADAPMLPALNGKNVVRDGESDLLTLTDGHAFLNTVPITARRVVYRRSVSQGSQGDGKGWETIVLPFAPSRISVVGENRDIVWRKQEGDDGKFWLRRFTGVNGTTCYFADAENFEAFTPYIVSFPDATLGELSLIGKTLEYSAEQVNIPAQAPMKLTTSTYSFVGTTTSQNPKNAYALNAEGTVFRLSASSVLAPFRANFVTTTQGVYYAPALRIGWDMTPTSIAFSKTATPSSTTPVYNLAGLRVGTAQYIDGQWQLGTLPRGLYIVNGQRISH